PSTALAQTSTSQPVDPPQEVAQLRQQYEGLTLEQAKAAGYEPEGECVSNPMGAGAMGTHAINQQYLMAHFPKGEMDPAQPPVLLLDQNDKVMGVEWEAKDVGQGPMQLFGQTIQIQSPHPGVEEPHYMLHIYFKPDGKVRFGTDPQTEFDPELSCSLPKTGGIVSPAHLAFMLAGLVGGLALLGVAFVGRQRLT
ncbi:MAG: hypothetical protein LC740_07245, partial [Actinobacteria bacterium]|nr:hypothetical protein [Actinomycetota bacterium]